ITQGITINGQGWAYVAPPIGGNAITINAGSGDAVNLDGLVLDGVGITGGTNGVVLNSGGSLIVNNCIIQHFTEGVGGNGGSGILFQPASGSTKFVITNTIMSNNSLAGFFYTPPNGSAATSTGVLDHVVSTNNGTSGIVFNTSTGGGAATASITNSTSSNNGG